VRALHLPSNNHIIQELRAIGVDPKAHDIFTKKAHCTILKMDALSCAQANVLKQTALVCGADAAIPKDTYLGRRKRKTPVLLFANERELQRIRQRLVEQDWLSPIVKAIDSYLNQRAVPILQAGKKRIVFRRTYIMGVINATPDSFYPGSRYNDEVVVRGVVREMENAGVDIIDVGAESSRPGVKPTPAKTEIKRLKKILPLVLENTKALVSVDTYKSDVAAYAVDNGASIINDISALRFDRKMARIVAKNKIGFVLMHMKGTPQTMQRNPQYTDCMGEIYEFFRQRIDHAQQSGIDISSIIIDPGLGFGKRVHDNYEIINRLAELTGFGRPICVGHSRKSFIGKPGKLPPEERLEGTLATQALLINNGASILRVHDVSEAKKAAVLIDTILS
jgi:dihydropteroate synthase